MCKKDIYSLVASPGLPFPADIFIISNRTHRNLEKAKVIGVSTLIGLGINSKTSKFEDVPKHMCLA